MMIVNSKMLADHFGVTRSRVCALAKQNKIPGLLLSSGYVFDLSDPTFRKIEDLRQVKKRFFKNL